MNPMVFGGSEIQIAFITCTSIVGCMVIKFQFLEEFDRSGFIDYIDLFFWMGTTRRHRTRKIMILMIQLVRYGET